MQNEIGIQDIFIGVIKFFKYQIKTITVFVVFGIILSLAYHLVKKPFYETDAIALSGICYFESGYDGSIEFLDPQAAIDLINALSEEINKRNVKELSSLLNLSEDIIYKIKFIDAEGIFKIDPENREIPLSKFKINLEVYDKNIIELLENALIDYFNNNNHVMIHYNAFKTRRKNMISEIDEEIKLIRDARLSNTAPMDLSRISISQRGGSSGLRNEIIQLFETKENYIKELELCKPLSFFKSFSFPENPKKMFVQRIVLGILISFFIGTIVALFRYMNIKNE